MDPPLSKTRGTVHLDEQHDPISSFRYGHMCIHLVKILRGLSIWTPRSMTLTRLLHTCHPANPRDDLHVSSGNNSFNSKIFPPCFPLRPSFLSVFFRSILSLTSLRPFRSATPSLSSLFARRYRQYIESVWGLASAGVYTFLPFPSMGLVAYECMYV
jgi:hypothetical protein